MHQIKNNPARWILFMFLLLLLLLLTSESEESRLDDTYQDENTSRLRMANQSVTPMIKVIFHHLMNFIYDLKRNKTAWSTYIIMRTSQT